MQYITHQIGKKSLIVMWYHYFFYSQFKYYSNSKWKDESAPPLFSTILFISVLQMMNFLVVRDVIIFHIQKSRYVYFSNETFIVPTIFIAINYLYFTYNKRYKDIIRKFDKRTREENRSFRFISWIYIILSAVFVVLMGYTVRNNIRWW